MLRVLCLRLNGLAGRVPYAVCLWLQASECRGLIQVLLECLIRGQAAVVLWDSPMLCYRLHLDAYHDRLAAEDEAQQP